jgi:predicted Zn-dependent protease with MMP-like domain
MSLEDLSIEQLRELAGQAEAMKPAFNLVSQLSKDPEARTMFQRYLKKKNPNLSIPEIDSEDRVMKALGEEKAAREKLEAQLTEERARAQVEQQRKDVISKYGLSDDDIKAIEKRMIRSDDNPDPLPPRYDWAAQLYVNSRTPSTPTPSSFMPPTYTMPEGKTWGKGIGNAAELNRIAMDEAYRAFADIKGGKVSAQ